MQKKFVIEYRSPEKLTPYAKNAKTHPTEQIDKIAGQISAFGFDQPIVITQDGVILKGHGRREAALRLGLAEVPVIVQTLDEYQAMASRIGDNKVAESKWDNDTLRFDMHTLDGLNFDLKLTGFEQHEIDNLMAPLGDAGFSDALSKTEDPWAGMPEFNQVDKTSFRHVIVHFADQAAVDMFFTLISQSDTGETKSIWFPPQERMDTESKRYDS